MVAPAFASGCLLSEGAGLDTVVGCDFETFGENLIAVLWAAMTLPIVRQSLLQLIYLISAPFVLFTIVFDKLVESSITFIGLETLLGHPSALSMLSHASISRMVLNSPRLLKVSDRCFTPLDFGNFALIDDWRVLVSRSTLARVSDSRTFQLSLRALIMCIHW